MFKKKTILLLTTLSLTLCLILPGCEYIVKKKLRKAKEQIEELVEASQIEVIGFWSDGCAPCKRAKIMLMEAGIQVTWIKADCYNQGMVQKYKIRVVPTFIIDTREIQVRTHDPNVIIDTIRKRAQQ